MLPELEQIKKRRRVLGITQFKLAKLVGVSQSLIAKVESGRLDPSYSNAKEIFLALDSLERGESKRVKDVMNNSIVRIEIGDLVKNAVRKMKRLDVSQLPVFDGNNNVGSISEKTIMDKLAEDEDMDSIIHNRIEEIMEGPFPTVEENLPIKAAASLLQFNQGLLVLRKGRFVGFLAKSDLLKS